MHLIAAAVMPRDPPHLLMERGHSTILNSHLWGNTVENAKLLSKMITMFGLDIIASVKFLGAHSGVKPMCRVDAGAIRHLRQNLNCDGCDCAW